MFWNNFIKLCAENNEKPNPVAKKLGISSGAITSWKKGSIPHITTVTKIADYFDVTVDYLLDKEDSSTIPSLTTNKIIELMNQNHCDNQELASALGLNRQVVTDWKAGRSKSYQKYLPQIADYFGVTVAYLLGKEEQKKPALEGELSQHDINLLKAYHENPELQATVDRILGIQKEGQVLLWAAAQSEDNHAPKVIYMSKERWNKIQSAPDTDDPLL